MVSYSAAAFCGLAAKYIEEYPDITAEQFRKVISLSFKDLGEPGYDTTYGFGLVDEEKLVENMQILKNTEQKIRSLRLAGNSCTRAVCPSHQCFKALISAQ